MPSSPVALITGSSSGIGAGIARRLAADGMTVVVNSARSAAAGRELAGALPGASYVRADVTDAAQCERLVETAVERHGRLDVLVNNAGRTRVIPAADLAAADAAVWREILDLNVIGTWQMSVAAVKHLRAGGAGNIVNISSVSGSRPVGSSIPYAVSKAAIDHMTRLLARTLGPDVRVNSVAPSLIETPWTADDPFFAEVARKVRAATPLGRVGTVEDVAEAVAAVLRSGYVTGAVVPVDGGSALI